MDGLHIERWCCWMLGPGNLVAYRRRRVMSACLRVRLHGNLNDLTWPCLGGGAYDGWVVPAKRRRRPEPFPQPPPPSIRPYLSPPPSATAPVRRRPRSPSAAPPPPPSVDDHGRRQGASPLTPDPPRALASAAVAHARLGREGRLRRLRQRRRQGHDHDRRQGTSPPIHPTPRAGSRARSFPPQALPLTLTPAGRVVSAGRWPPADVGCAGARWQGMQAGGQTDRRLRAERRAYAPLPTAVARWVGGTAGGAAFGSALNNCQLLLSTEIP